MKTSSLSMRLGLTVSLMGAGLVRAAGHPGLPGPDPRAGKLARKGLENKMDQIRAQPQPRASTPATSAAAPTRCWTWSMGHDNIYLTIIEHPGR